MKTKSIKKRLTKTKFRGGDGDGVICNTPECSPELKTNYFVEDLLTPRAIAKLSIFEVTDIANCCADNIIQVHKELMKKYDDLYYRLKTPTDDDETRKKIEADKTLLINKATEVGKIIEDVIKNETKKPEELKKLVDYIDARRLAALQARTASGGKSKKNKSKSNKTKRRKSKK